jgi:hypothetical protein
MDEEQDCISGLTWSDPDEEVTSYIENPRGSGFLFGRIQTQQFYNQIISKF